MERLLTNHIDELTLILDDYSSSNDLELAETRKKLKNKLFLNKIFKVISLVLIYVLLVIFSIVAIFPFYWMIITSLKNFQEVSLIPATFYPTYGVYFSNYIDVFTRFSFETYLLNTIIVIIISTLGTLLTTILTAFAFAKLEFKGRDTLFTIFLATMMIPSELFVITNFITCYRYGLLDIISIDPSYNPNYQIDNILNALKTYFAIMLPFIVNVFYIYLLRQNFKQVPNELYLASKVDGKSDWTFLWKIMVPIASPTIITITILKIISSWNAYAWPSMVSSVGGANASKYAIMTVGLQDFTNFLDEGGMRTLVNLEMAAAFLVTIPLIVLFIVFRKYIMKGSERAGIKG